MALPASRWFSDRTAAALIAALSLLAYGRGVLPGRVLSPVELLACSYPWRASHPNAPLVDPGLSDVTFAFHPWLSFASGEVKRGNLPLWNPHTYCGSPFAGAMQTALFSPFNALAYVLPVPTAIGLACVLKSAFAGLSMYWFLRLLLLSPVAALLGGISFMFSGFVSVWLEWSLGSVAVWMPALFAGVELVRRDLTPRSAVPLAIATGCQFLCGHPETSLHILSAAGCWAVFRVAGTDLRRYALIVGAGFAVGALIAAVQVLPFLDYFPRTLTWEQRLKGGLGAVIDIRGVIMFLVPRFFGNAGLNTGWDEWFRTWANYNEVSSGVGPVPLVLLPAAIAGWRDRRTAFFLALALLLFPCIYEVSFLPLHRLLVLLPGYGVSANYRLILVLGFALCVLAAMGLENLLAGSSDRVRLATGAWAAVLTCAVVVVTVANRREMVLHGAWEWVGPRAGLAAAAFACAGVLARRSIRGGVASVLFLVGLEAAVMAPFAGAYIPSTKAGEFYPETGAITFLKRNAGLDRSITPFTNLSQVYGLYEPGGYDAMNPRLIAGFMGGEQNPVGNSPVRFARGYSSRLLDLIAVKYVLVAPSDLSPGPRFRKVYDGRDGKVYLNPRAMPRAFLAGKARVMGSGREELDALVGGGLDLRNCITLVGGDPVPAASGPVRGRAEITAYAPNRVVVRTEAGAAAWLFLSDSWDPGWKATVDGREERIHRADHAFRAVRVGAGDHTVVFTYLPVSFRVGLLLTILGLVAVILAGSLGGRKAPLHNSQ